MPGTTSPRDEARFRPEAAAGPPSPGPRSRSTVAALLIGAQVLAGAAWPAAAAAGSGRILIDDFESYRGGDLPAWRIGRRNLPYGPRFIDEDEYFVVREEGGRRFLRGFTRGEAIWISLPNGEGYDWDLATHPRLRWDWRVHQLPKGAREDRKSRNDAGAAVYVIFSRDWKGRTKGLKYTYSSSLPPGTLAEYGPLKVLVVASGLGQRGAWQSVERDVAADYRRAFGKAPPDRPVTIAVWSDSDSTKESAEVDFDNLLLLPARD